MPPCVCRSCGSAVQVDESRRFVRCDCGVTVARGSAAPTRSFPRACEVAGERAVRIDQEIESIVARLKRLEAELVADFDRGAATCAHLDDFARRHHVPK